MTEGHPIRVIIRNPEGHYLSRGRKGWEFSRDRDRAIVFDYEADNIAEYLEVIRKSQGPKLEAVSAEPKDIHETCDQCKQVIHSEEMFFDGARYLCSPCHRRNQASPGA
jgi:hypothetical protein